MPRRTDDPRDGSPCHWMSDERAERALSEQNSRNGRRARACSIDGSKHSPRAEPRASKQMAQKATRRCARRSRKLQAHSATGPLTHRCAFDPSCIAIGPGRAARAIQCVWRIARPYGSRSVTAGESSDRCRAPLCPLTPLAVQGRAMHHFSRFARPKSASPPIRIGSHLAVLRARAGPNWHRAPVSSSFGATAVGED
jgi:hypothetical protein